ncbi:MAG: hypothetical protein HY927_09415 [Elusimicrobia bacterium]|nr:hypothetical protein [Elusimicrobiota bacterium]
MSEPRDGCHAPMTFPYNMGVLLAVNAVADAYLVLDGPGCSFYRGMMIHGRHDWASTLLSVTGHHRFQFCGVSADSIATSYELKVREVIRKVGELPHAKAVLVTSLPMCTVAGTDYGRLLNAELKRKPGLVVPARALAGGWLDGYAATLDTLAEGLDLAGGRPRAGDVAVVGYFMDRGEGEHRGNVAELGRLCRGLGLRLVSTWLSGSTVSGLKRVRHARTIISLPHGRRAAAILARRVKAGLVEMDLPFGLAGTEAWVRRLGAALGRKRQAEAFIDKELGRAAARLEWVVPFSFLNRKVVFIGDPHLARGMAELCSEVGASLEAAFLTGRPEAAASNGRKGGRRPAQAAWEVEPHTALVRRRWDELSRRGVDLLVGNTDAFSLLKPGCACVEFGYPSISHHVLRDEPYLGFEGAVGFYQRMMNSLASPNHSPPPRGGE